MLHLKQRIAPLRRAPRRRSRALPILALPAIALALLSVFAGCTDVEFNFRRGTLGDSCMATNDCEAPHHCVANVCGGPPTVGQGGSGGAGGVADDGGVVGDGPSAEAGPWNACDECLDTKCAAEIAACGPECVGVEACLEELCSGLSAIGSADEGMCQASCQGQYPGGKAPHIAVVDCAIKATCRPPCLPYPDDYNACRAFMNKGDCAGALAACEASAECLAYRSCVSACTSLAECVDCGSSLEGANGKKLLREYEICIATECMSESWLLEEGP